MDMKYNWTQDEHLNAQELRRMECNIESLNAQLDSYGYWVKLSHKTDWVADNLLYQSDINRIRNNIDALQKGFTSLPDWRAIVYNTTLDAGQINAWEWDMQTLAQWLARMVESFVYCGTFYAGEEWLT